MDLRAVDKLLTTTRSIRRRFDLSRPVPADVIRAVAGIGAIAFTAFALLGVLREIRYGIDPPEIILETSVVAVSVIVCWWLALRGHRADSG